MPDLTDPRLADCRRLFLRDFEVPVRIGVHGFEQQAPQRMRFNVDLFVPLAATTPRFRSSGVSCSSRFRAPRSLKLPVKCRLSNLTQTSAPVSCDSRRE